MKKKLLGVFIIFLFTSCYTTQYSTEESDDAKFEKKMNNWKGKTKKALLMEWGSPQNISSDGDDGEILTFTDLRRGYFKTVGYVTVTHKYLFYINSERIIYHWKYERNGRQGM